MFRNFGFTSFRSAVCSRLSKAKFFGFRAATLRQPGGRVSVENIEAHLVCRIKKGSSHFETLCRPGMVDKFRDGKATTTEVLETYDIFKDARKSERPSDDELQSAFGTTSREACIQEVLRQGEVQLTASDRHKKTQEKLDQIIQYITQNFVDPVTGRPHSANELQKAMKGIKALKIEPSEPLEHQSEGIVKRIESILPMERKALEAEVVLPAEYVASIGMPFKKMCGMRREFLDQHNYRFLMSFPAKDYDRIIEELRKATRGNFVINVSDFQPLPSALEKTGKGNIEKQPALPVPGHVNDSTFHHDDMNPSASRLNKKWKWSSLSR